MRYLLFIFIVLVLFSCEKNETNPNVKENVEISLAFTFYHCKCNGIGLPTVELIDGGTYIYNPDDIPNEIKNQVDWQNKEYIATLKIKDETCECELGVDPIPGNPLPTENLQKAEIIEINEK